jgi:ribonuclease HI
MLARDLGIKSLNIFSDSQLIINQMTEVAQIKDYDLYPLNKRARDVANDLKISFEYDRELNVCADYLSNEALKNI